MNDLIANQIVFVILILIIAGILFALNMIGIATLLGKFVKNNSGNYSGYRIIMFALALAAILVMLYWAFKPKRTMRASATRLVEKY
jgi:hypothetical protein